MTNTETFWEDPETDTPRCDQELRRIEKQYPESLAFVALHLARKLERETNVQRRRIYELEEELERLTGC